VRTRENAAAAATPTDLEPRTVLAGFQDQIGAPPSTAKAIVMQLVLDCGGDWVRDAIQDAAICELEA